ncbi:ATP-binding protein [Thermodesulfobacteriota bacterium]
MQEKEIYQALTEGVGAPASKLLPGIWKMLVTPEEGKMLLELPASAEELAEKFSIGLEEMKKQVEEWVVKGVVIPFGKEGIEKYGLCRGAVNFFESASHVAYEMVGEDLLTLWGEWLQTEWLDDLRNAQEPVCRVFPFNEAIKDTSSILPQEDVNARIDQAWKIAAVECPCRLTLKRCDHTVECCLLFDRGAELALRRGSGKELTKEQTKDLIRSCVEEGLVPQGGNRIKLTNLCLCCMDCCLIFQPQIELGLNVAVPSRYLSVVDVEQCDGCQTCVEVCPFEAVEMAKMPGSKKLKARIDADKCYGCGVCVPNCPEEALDLKAVRPAEHLPAA